MADDFHTKATGRGAECASSCSSNKVVFLAGGIASGKTTVAKLLEDRGAWVCDLDQVSRDILSPGSDLTKCIASEFGEDLIDVETGELDRSLLAKRVFSSVEKTQRLEDLEMPTIKKRLSEILMHSSCSSVQPKLTVIEVPLLDRIEDLLSLADEVLVIVAPEDIRRSRAIERGMEEGDFTARVSKQPTDDYLRAHATTVINNDGNLDALLADIDAWLNTVLQ